MVENPPANAGDMSSIPGQGTKIPRASGQRGLCSATRETTSPRSPGTETRVTQLAATRESLHTTKTQNSQRKKRERNEGKVKDVL